MYASWPPASPPGTSRRDCLAEFAGFRRPEAPRTPCVTREECSRWFETPPRPSNGPHLQVLLGIPLEHLWTVNSSSHRRERASASPGGQQCLARVVAGSSPDMREVAGPNMAAPSSSSDNPAVRCGYRHGTPQRRPGCRVATNAGAAPGPIARRRTPGSRPTRASSQRRVATPASRGMKMLVGGSVWVRP